MVGECNSFAFKAAVSVTENLGGRNTNPMLIWGEPGQGKTHLLKAMASSICEKHPDKKAIYVTGEEFTNDFIACIPLIFYSVIILIYFYKNNLSCNNSKAKAKTRKKEKGEKKAASEKSGRSKAPIANKDKVSAEADIEVFKRISILFSVFFSLSYLC